MQCTKRFVAAGTLALKERLNGRNTRGKTAHASVKYVLLLYFVLLRNAVAAFLVVVVYATAALYSVSQYLAERPESGSVVLQPPGENCSC